MHQTALKKTVSGAGKVRCLACRERFSVDADAHHQICPHCGMEWRISWFGANPKVRGPVWEKITERRKDTVWR
jgi:hypothetical protein